MVQHENAAFLEAQGGAQVIADQDMAAQLANTVLGLMADEAELQRRSRAMAALAVPDAARRIADLIRAYRQPQKGTSPA